MPIPLITSSSDDRPDHINIAPGDEVPFTNEGYSHSPSRPEGGKRMLCRNPQVEPLRNDLSPKRKSSRKDRSFREAPPMSVEPTVVFIDLDRRATKD